jgi:hypothetical protein
MSLLASVRLLVLITVVDPAENPLLPKSVVVLLATEISKADEDILWQKSQRRR